MTRKPDFTRLRTALMGGRPDAVPLCELYHDLEIRDRYMGTEVNTTRDIIEFYAEAGYDFIPVNVPVEGRPLLSEAEEADVTRADRAERAAMTERTYAESDNESIVITNRDEFESYNWPDPDAIDLSYFDQLPDLFPEGMKAIVTQGGTYEDVSQMMGYENYCLALYDDPELVAGMYDKIGAWKLAVFERIIGLDSVGAVWHSDDLGYTEGLLFDPAVMRQYLFPWYKRMGNLAKRHDKPFIFHSDGKLWEIIEDLIDCGYDALQPIEPKSWDAREVKARYGDRLCLIGTIDLDRLLCRGTPQEVESAVKRDIDELGWDGGFCIGTSNTPAYYMDIDNFRAMVEATIKYG
jgi:uroporphyrinogen decarboxylase